MRRKGEWCEKHNDFFPNQCQECRLDDIPEPTKKDLVKYEAKGILPKKKRQTDLQKWWEKVKDTPWSRFVPSLPQRNFKRGEGTTLY